MFLMSTEENPEQNLFAAIDRNFTGNNRIEARNTVEEILKNIDSQEERKGMIEILLSGIIAEHEQKNKNSVFDRINKKHTYGEPPKSSPSHTQER